MGNVTFAAGVRCALIEPSRDDGVADEVRLSASELLPAVAPRAAAEAFHAIACDDGVADEVRLSAAEQLAALGPRAAAEPS
jgi:hypothetical protein